MELRNLKESDYSPITSVVNDWWGGRQISHLLQRLFFEHFKETGFVIENDKLITAFLVGFISQSCPNEAYIHFVGVHPEYRRLNLGRQLYEKFFDVVKSRGCNVIKCITSPVNKVSIGFHKKMGFVIEPGDSVVDGVEVCKDHAGPGQPRVRFKKDINW